MFTKFEFPKGGKTEEDGPGEMEDQSQQGDLELPEDRPLPALSRLPPPPSVLENEESCNMWHLFNYFDESCVDLTEVYSSGNTRSLSRNCSTPAPGGNPAATGAAHPTGVGQIFHSHDLSSNHRTSFGGGGPDAHDASWMCVVNMADLHSQDSSNATDLNHRFTDRSRQGGIYQSIQQNAIPTTAAGQLTTAVSCTAPDSTTETKVLQFSAAASQVKNEQATSSNVITLQPSIMTLSDFKDYRVHIKQQGYENSNGVMSDSTPLSVATSSVTSHIATRPILVLTSCQPMSVSTPIEKPVKSYPKPAYSYSCLIAMALKNSTTGVLPVNEIYTFMTENFPYFQTAPDGWKNSVRHNLSLNKCFRKIDNPNTNGHARKGCLWGLNESRIAKMDEEIIKWRKKDPEGIRRSMYYPDRLESIERGIITASLNSPVTKSTTAGSFVLSDDVLVDLYTEPADSTLTHKVFGSEDVLDELLYAGMDGKAGVGKQSPAMTFVRSTQTMLKNSSVSPVVAFNTSRQAEVSRSFTIRAEI